MGQTVYKRMYQIRSSEKQILGIRHGRDLLGKVLIKDKKERRTERDGGEPSSGMQL